MGDLHVPKIEELYNSIACFCSGEGRVHIDIGRVASEKKCIILDHSDLQNWYLRFCVIVVSKIMPGSPTYPTPIAESKNDGPKAFLLFPNRSPRESLNTVCNANHQSPIARKNEICTRNTMYNANFLS